MSTDKLTGLLEAKDFTDRLLGECERALRYRRPLTLLLIELAYDAEGQRNLRHTAGYFLQRQVAALVRRQIRRMDVGGRVNGDRLAVLLPETTLSGAQQAGERLLGKVAESTFRIGEDGNPVRISISLGLATFPYHGVEARELMATADKALCMARAKGGHAAVVYPEHVHDPAEVFRTLAPPFHGNDWPYGLPDQPAGAPALPGPDPAEPQGRN